jgi:hypothetical protein
VRSCVRASGAAIGIHKSVEGSRSVNRSGNTPATVRTVPLTTIIAPPAAVSLAK